MSISDILVPVLSARADEPALAAADQLHAQLEHASVSVLAFLRGPIRQEAILSADGGVWASVAEPIADSLDPNRRQRSLLARRLERFADKPRINFIEIESGAEADSVGLVARAAGLVVMMRPFGIGEESFRRAMFESALYEAGRPLILVPPRRSAKSIGKVVLVAWDGSREGARAMADAHPILERAENIYVFSIDVGARDGPAGADASAHLRRSGLRCHQRTVSGQRHEIERLLLGECAALDVDLLVMGGYGHPRIHEFLFGGVTRALIRASPISLFLSR